MVDDSRVTQLKEGKEKHGPVVYWMSRDMRISDNWALLFAANLANRKSVPLTIVFALAPVFGAANSRHYSFLLNGLEEVEKEGKALGIGFSILLGNPEQTVVEFLEQQNASVLVSDFDPLRIKRVWSEQVTSSIEISHFQVDAHNIVPCRIASNKLEFGAYTLRPKISKFLPKYLTNFPELPELTKKINSEPVQWRNVLDWLAPDDSVKPINWLKPGETEAKKQLQIFLNGRLNGYSEARNNPLADGQSDLSPYLHFGHISAQRIAIEVSKSIASDIDKSAFLEELIVRRELSDNFCFYNPNYDNIEGIHSWAKETLQKHWNDEREFTYSLEELERAKTHDPLWNAAQLQMVKTGKMHGYMRMYWAKKILEWTANPGIAMQNAILLNDKYSLDGRDPNGYAGVAWSIGGIHDRAWSERPVFGKIRYMNYNGCKRKFNVDGYIKMINEL
jgi:deoxyribodipyrimidine photo-lyase